MYMTIEGVIGSGKTSLTNLLSNEYKAYAVYEKFEKNPYLEKFYTNIEKYAFQTEMFFLIDRYNQMLETKEEFLDDGANVIADYNLAKSLIFAQRTLSEENYNKFSNIYDILIKDFVKPDLIIIIKSDLETLKKHILKRGREYEKDIKDEYLEYLINKYDEYIKLLKKNHISEVLVIEGSKYDFVDNSQDKKEVLILVENYLKKMKK